MEVRSGIYSLINLLGKPHFLFPRLIHAQVEPCNFCNLHCRMCMWEKVPVSKKILRVSEFRRILSEIRPGYITFSGYGEPLLNRNLEEMIRIAKRRGVVLNTTTNGLLLEERCETLVRSGVDLVSVSLDAPNAELYRHIRNSDAFSQVLRGISRFVEMRRRLHLQSKIRISFVIQESNLDVITSFLNLARELRVDAVLFQLLEPFEVVIQKGLQGQMTEGQLRGKLLDAYRVAQEMSITTNLQHLLRDLSLLWRTKYLDEENDIPCKMIWFSTMVSCHGEVRPCCFFACDPLSYGNLNEDSLDHILNGVGMRAFRGQLRAGRRPHPICRRCVPLRYRDILLPGYDRF